ncbi:MAG: phosphoglucosamine mutase [Clostridia bacterium]|nr:phosphoglucosamine mutase [Clostridia bacterium]
MRKYFGTDGVRGVANTELTPELAFQLGKYGAHVLTEGKENVKIVIGRDTRISGDLLEHALVAGILSAGCDALCVGVVPTPAISYLTRYLEADAGIVISASHNPMEFNGIKFFNSDGFKLNDEVELEIEKYIEGELVVETSPTGDKIGRCEYHDEAGDLYQKFVMSTIEGDLKGIKIAVDTANGAAHKVAIKTLQKLGADITSIHNEPNGININEHCGSTHPEQVAELVKIVGADIGLAFDGDADRLMAVDENGQIVDGDKIMTICGIHLNAKHQLKDHTIVSTVMSNLGFDIALKENGLRTVKTKVGDRYVLEEMRKSGYVLGGEQSGHVIFLEHNTTGDGLLTAVQLLNVMKTTGKKLSELASVMQVYPQVLKNAKIENSKKNAYQEDPVIVKRIEELEQIMAGQGRVLIRPSGTEPLVRVMLEGKNQEELDTYASELVALIEERLN